MKMLRISFNILVACGCWKPESWTSRWKRALYTVYAIFQFLVIYSFALSQCAETAFNVNSAADFTDSVYMLLSTIASCCKITTFTLKYKDINMLLGKLEKEPFKPASVDEFKIRDKFNRTILSRTLKYTILVESTVTFIIIASIFRDFTSRQLLYKAWLPYNHSAMSLYVPTYVHQLVSFILTANLGVACDCIVCGLLMHTCCQIEILQHRLKSITPNTTNNIWDCVVHHNYIYRYAIMINENFRIVVGLQFLTSTLIVCVTLYELTITQIGPEFMQFVLYMSCMMIEIFTYCWHGNQLKVKSTELIDTIFEMRWPDLDKTTRKDVLMIMRRAMVPIEFTSAYVLTMDLDTFVGILKLSYSTYNLLQTTTDSK